jgi:hypothetical protein
MPFGKVVSSVRGETPEEKLLLAFLRARKEEEITLEVMLCMS